ncbi:MFS transporter [Chromobacterium violaceum]|uniref:Multidrug efflux system protein MdtL n=1 Tax=Chromobacterium violaceum TaxID=536 RepID=A0AAX2M592_CHRVL|nr:MFS transporter [Chromobacterium violaceum]STB71493.1 multidrug efflux system protein MdtL [Chromobacterium violaceum]SUX31529.1 multidrug efflux system protein MdtL [Chromobacterium violaceum]
MPTLPTSPRQAWLNWSISVAFVVLVFGFQTGYAVTNGKIASSLGLSLADIGLVGSVYTWCFALSQLLSGSLLDRVGARRVLPIACSLLAIGAALVAGAGSLAELLWAQLPLGLGASFGFISAGFISGSWFAPQRYGVMFAWVQFVASVAAFLSQVTLSRSLAAYPWRAVIYSIAMSGLLLVAVMLLWLRDPPGWEDGYGWPKQPLRFVLHALDDVVGVARTPGMASNLVIGAVSFGAMLALGVVWAPKLVFGQGIVEEGAHLAAAFCWFGLAFGAPAFAKLSDLVGSRKKPLLLGVVVELVLLVALLWGGLGLTWQFSLVFFLFGFVAGASMLSFIIGCELAGARRAGTASALVNGSQFVLGGMMMALPGELFGRFGQLELALAVLPLLVLLVLPLFGWLRETAAPVGVSSFGDAYRNR